MSTDVSTLAFQLPKQLHNDWGTASGNAAAQPESSEKEELSR